MIEKSIQMVYSMFNLERSDGFCLPAGVYVRLLVTDLFERRMASTITNRNPAHGGGLAEWFKAHAWKACGRNPSQVQILYPPPCAG